jgi:uncharacterized membrane protein YgdD (TMEM256/DUF423 family)
MRNGWLGLAGLIGFLAVAAGAFGAHGLEGRFTEKQLEHWELAATYQLYHALALAVGAVLPACRTRRIALIALTAGIIIFSGSLYLLAATRVGLFGAITPVGGTALLVGWGMLGWYGFQRSRRPPPSAAPAP